MLLGSQPSIPIPFKNCKAAQVGYNSERSLRDDTKHMPSKHSLLGARCFQESDYEPNLWTKNVNFDEGWNLIRTSLKHLFSCLAEKCKGWYPNNVGAAHQAVSGAITAQKKKKCL